MTENIITLTKLSDSSYLLKINTSKILINIGNIPEITETYDAILISNFSYKHINTLQQFKECTNVFMTVPTYTLSKVVYRELYNTKYIKDKSDDKLKNTYMTEAQIDEIFSTFNQLKYSQPYEISENLVITAYRSGYALGNSIWKIKKDNEVILICNDINHRKENHVDGLDIETFRDVNICIMQAYDNYLENSSNKKFEDQLRACIDESDRVFVFVDYVRLVEICYLLNDILIDKNEKGTVLSNYGISFLQAVRGMTEWAGERVLKDFSKNKDKPFRFDKLKFVDNLEEINNFVIVVDESVNNFLTNAILYKYQNCEKTSIIFLENETFFHKINSEKGDLTFDVPVIVPYTKEEYDVLKNEHEALKKKAEEDRIIAEYLKTKVEESEDEVYTFDTDVAKNMFWYQYKYDFWITEETKKYASFPVLKPLRFDEYGEKFIFHGEASLKHTEQKINKEKNVEDKNDNSIPTTKVTWQKEKISLKNKRYIFTSHGNSDFESIINILELTQPKKLIFFGNEKPVDYYFYYFSFNPNFKDVFTLKDELNLNIDAKNYEYLEVDDDFYSHVHFKKNNEYYYASFNGNIENKKLSFLERSRPFLIGSIKSHELKNRFIGEGFKVELSNNVLIVEDKIEILVKGKNEIEIKGELDDTYMSIRNVIYKEFIFL